MLAYVGGIRYILDAVVAIQRACLQLKLSEYFDGSVNKNTDGCVLYNE